MRAVAHSDLTVFKGMCAVSQEVGKLLALRAAAIIVTRVLSVRPQPRDLLVRYVNLE